MLTDTVADNTVFYQVLTRDPRALEPAGLPAPDHEVGGEGAQWLTVCDVHLNELFQLARTGPALSFYTVVRIETGPCLLCVAQGSTHEEAVVSEEDRPTPPKEATVAPE